jgi:hypothetical protein
MSHTSHQIPGIHPAVSFLLSCMFMLVAKVIPELNGVQPWHLPVWLMEISQVIAWWCVPGTFAIALLNYLGIKINPFKKKKGK